MAKEFLTETIQGEVKIEERDGAMYFSGPFGKADIKNLNGRVYPRAVMEQALTDYNTNFVQKRRALGELNHPEYSEANPERAAFIIEKDLTMDDQGIIFGEGKVLKNFPMGEIAYNIFDEKIAIGISSRGLGDITEKTITENEEDSKILEVSDFEITAFDLVTEPSIGEFVGVSEKKKLDTKKEQVKESEKDNIDLVELARVLLK